MKTANLVTEPFSCPSCVKKIENALNKSAGVEDVRVMFNSSKVKVTFDEAVTDLQTLADVVTRLGYPVIKSR